MNINNILRITVRKHGLGQGLLADLAGLVISCSSTIVVHVLHVLVIPARSSTQGLKTALFLLEL